MPYVRKLFTELHYSDNSGSTKEEAAFMVFVDYLKSDDYNYTSVIMYF